MQKNSIVVSIDSYEDVPVNNEAALQKAAASQPVAVAIEAGGWDFQLYQSVSINDSKTCIGEVKQALMFFFLTFRVSSQGHVDWPWTTA